MPFLVPATGNPVAFVETTDVYWDACVASRSACHQGGGIYNPSDFRILDDRNVLLFVIHVDSDGQCFERNHDGSLILDNEW